MPTGKAGRARPDRGAVLFDIDGTLVDNSYFHTVAWWRACREMGLVLPMARLHRLVGMGADQLVQALLGHASPELAESHSRHAAPFFDEMVAFDGAGELVTATGRLGLVVALATSARASEVKRLGEIVGIDTEAVEVVSSESVDASKPAPDIFSVALDRSGVPAQRTIAVGDTRWDVEAAGRAGVACIAVTTGGWSEAELIEAGAVRVYGSVREVLDDLEGGPIGELAR